MNSALKIEHIRQVILVIILCVISLAWPPSFASLEAGDHHLGPGDADDADKIPENGLPAPLAEGLVEPPDSPQGAAQVVVGVEVVGVEQERLAELGDGAVVPGEVRPVEKLGEAPPFEVVRRREAG